MNVRNKRYGSAKSKPKDKKPLKFIGRLLRQMGVCAAVFVLCIPVSRTDSAISAYISNALVSTSDIELARQHFIEMCARIDAKYPPLAENVIWSGFMELMDKKQKTEEPPPTPQEQTTPSAEEALELVAKASPDEFTYPENVNMVMPLNGEVTSPFGIRVHPVSGEDASHYGVDIAGKKGDPIITTAPGRVIRVQTHDIYGNCVLIQHTERIASFYAHMEEIHVKEGDIAGEGMVIGTVGSTGVTTGPHLHFSVRVDGEPTDPEKYIEMVHR